MQSPQYTQYIKSNFNCDYRNIKFIVSSGWMHAFLKKRLTVICLATKNENKKKKKKKKEEKKKGGGGGGAE